MVLQFVRSHERDWRWWDNPECERPLVSILAVTPEDEFEAGRPERGVAVRLRCAWESTKQGQPKRPIAELVSLTIDSGDASPTLVTARRHNGQGLDDHYHRRLLPDAEPGRHTATAVVRLLAMGDEVKRTIEFCR